MVEEQRLQNIQSEGKDVQLFRVRMRGIFEKTVACISIDRFEEIYGAALQGRQSRTKHLHEIWQATALDAMVKELNEAIVEENLDEKLKERARIIEECQADNGTIAWRPPGNPTEHVRSLDMKEKIKRKKQLEDFVNSKEVEVEQLKREVSAGRMHVCQLENILDDKVNKLHSFFEGEKKYQAELQAHFGHLTSVVESC